MGGIAQADVLRNLGSLQNIAALLQNEEGENLELAGTSQQIEAPEQFQFPQTPSNPEEYADFGGGQQLPEGLELLSEIIQTEGKEDALDAVAETAPPGVDEGQAPGRGFLGAIADYFSPQQRQQLAEQNAQLFEDRGLAESGPGGTVLGAVGDYFRPSKREEVSEQNIQRTEEVARQDKARGQGLTLDQYNSQYVQDQEQWKASMAEALQEPYSRTVYGATDEVLNSPELRKEVEKIGVEITPEMELMTKKMELALSDMDEVELKAQGEWDPLITEIRERIDRNQANDTDKFFVGLALLMPLIVGGIFGAEAGLEALSSSTQGLMDVYAGREKGIREDEASLRELSKLKEGSKIKQKELEIERAKIPGQVKKLLGDAPLEHLKGMNLVTFTDSEGNQVQGVSMKPGLVAKLEFVEDKEAKKDMRSQAEELNQNRAAIAKLAGNSRRIIEIAQQIDDQSFFENVFQSWSIGKKGSIVKKYGKDIMLDGRKQNSAVALVHVLEDTLEARRNMQKIKAFNPALFEHFGRILTSPYGEFTSPQDLIDQTMHLYTDSRNQFLDDAERRGFIKDPLLDDFYSKDVKMFNSLNRQEQKGEVSKTVEALRGQEHGQ